MRSFILWISLGCLVLAAPAYSPARATLDGVWDQYYGDFFTCRLSIESGSGGYRATTLQVAPGVEPQVIRTYGHRLERDLWTFQSDWGDRGIAEFRLRRQGPDRFQGYAYLKGKSLQNLTTWVRKRPL